MVGEEIQEKSSSDAPVARSERKPICLITGASSGIGESLAREMVEQGWFVIGVARRTERMQILQDDLGQENFIYYPCDVTNPKDILNVTHFITGKDLIPSLFFLNAGTGWPENQFEVHTDLHQKTFAVNYFGAIAWVEHWLPLVKERGATFVGTSSVAGLHAIPGAAAYCASKAALRSFFEAYNLMNQDSSINFICVFPGPVKTAMLKGANMLFTWSPEKAAHYIVKKVLKGKRLIVFPPFWNFFFRLLNWLPSSLGLKAFSLLIRQKS